MRVKLTAKHPRPASSERAPVRPGSSTARKPARPAAPASKTASSNGPRGGANASTGKPAARRAATDSGESPQRAFGKTAGATGERRSGSATARSGERPTRAGGAASRERGESGSFERRPTGERPARKEGVRATGGIRRDTEARTERRTPSERSARKEGTGAGGFRRDADARTERRAPSERPARGAYASGDGAGARSERAPRFARDDDGRGARRAPRENEERRSGPRQRDESPRSRFAAERGGSEERRPRGEGAPRRPRGEQPEARGERTYARPVKAAYEGRDTAHERRPCGEGAARRARDEMPARSERSYAKPVKTAYTDRADDTPTKAAPRASKAKRDTRSIEDSFDRPARFERPAEKPARKPCPAAAPRHRDEGEYNDAPGNLRLSKLMSELGLCSRREADEWIEKGWVTVDGVVIDTLGTKVRPDADIQIDPAAEAAQLKQVTILVHKPVGYVSGQAEDGYEPAVTLVKPENRWEGDRTDIRFSAAHLRQLAPAGRLDIDSTGLLVLTQDGRVAKQLIGGHSEIDKEYLVRVTYGDVETDVEHEFPAESLAKLRHGLELDGVPLKPAMVSWQNGEQLRFVLREGKKRQIRRMCELVGLHVVGLKRVRMGHVILGALPPGQWRYLGPDESF
jgi:23S rRNA pseudouridine2604 synthase